MCERAWGERGEGGGVHGDGELQAQLGGMTNLEGGREGGRRSVC